MKSVQDLSNLKFQIQSNQNLQLLLNSSCLYCLTVLSDTSPFLDGMTASGRDHNPLLLNTHVTPGGACSMRPAAGNKTTTCHGAPAAQCDQSSQCQSCRDRASPVFPFVLQPHQEIHRRQAWPSTDFQTPNCSVRSHLHHNSARGSFIYLFPCWGKK